MFKSISSVFHLRSLILLLLLTSSDVHMNPGPFASMRTVIVNTSPQTITVPVNSSYSSVKIAFSMIVASGNSNSLTITSTTPGFNFTFAPQIANVFTSSPMEIGPNSAPFNISFSPSGFNSFHVLVSISFSNVEKPIPVSIINPAVLPVQIDNTDPIPITGQVSVANPIPSVTSTILNAFKK